MSKTIRDVILEEEIPFPSSAEQAQEIRKIVGKAMPAEQNGFMTILSTIKQIGLRNIFYQSGMVFEFAMVLFLIGFVGVFFIADRGAMAGYLVIGIFPVLHLLLSIFMIWQEGQQNMIELKMSLRYSVPVIACLRMLLYSLIALGADIIGIVIMQYRFPIELSIVAAGFSFLFLFAFLSLQIILRWGNERGLLFLLVGWIAVCALLYRLGGALHQILFVTIPIYVHILAGLIWFCLFIIKIEKVVKEEAKSVCYQSIM